MPIINIALDSNCTQYLNSYKAFTTYSLLKLLVLGKLIITGRNMLLQLLVKFDVKVLKTLKQVGNVMNLL